MKFTKMTLSVILAVFCFTPAASSETITPSVQWSKQKANQWYDAQPWLVGCNFTPSTAINQLEMWQADTFDPQTIDRELGWAQEIGLNVIRVYLHDLLWQQDQKAFLTRIDHFLAIADQHEIQVIFVLFDGCWDPQPRLGKQRVPKPHIHNSGWVQSPHTEILRDPVRHDELESYVKGVMERFKKDHRVLLWDLYNEPDNSNRKSYPDTELPDKAEMAFILLRKVFAWGREVNPDQPMSVCLWKGDWREDQLTQMDRFIVENSDIITYHNYECFTKMQEKTEQLLAYDRPMICTEYMSRPTGSTFIYMLPFFKEHQIGAVNWGFVAGKTQTQYSWDSWEKQYTSEPELWFHEILRPDGSPYDKEELAFIKMITSNKILGHK